MKKMLQLKADRVGDGAGRGRKILQQRSTRMEGATSSCTSSTAATTIPFWEMEAGDAHQGRGWQERKSSGRGEMVFLIFSCASGPGAKEQGLCWSAGR